MMQSRELAQERLLNELDRRLRTAEDKVSQALQQIPRMAGGSGGSGSAPPRLGWCRIPTGGVAAATGTWPTLTTTSFTADVYVTGKTEPVATGATIVWKYLDGADEGKLVACYPNNTSGTSWDAIVNSCTGVDLDA